MLDIKSKEYETMIEEMKQGKEVVVTKWGRAKINHYGYYVITSKKEGNNRIRLHTLIWEDFYGKKIPEGYEIHHVDTNKQSNSIQNLQCVEKQKHLIFHKTGKKRPEMSGKDNYFAKYDDLWDISSVHYFKADMTKYNRKPNPCKCFGLKYKGKDVPVGKFVDFVTPKIICDLMNEFIEEDDNL